jgi:hypothetical protein
LFVLATEANDQRIRDNREQFARGFPVRAAALISVVAGEDSIQPRGRALALIDPRSKRRDWLRPARADGRRSAAPYADYLDFMRQIRRSGRSSSWWLIGGGHAGWSVATTTPLALRSP